MAESEHELLIGRLAVHYKVLTKEQLADALRRKRQDQSPFELGSFLVAEGLITPQVLTKLERAREQWLEKQQGRAAGEPVAPEPAHAVSERPAPIPLSPVDSTPIPLSPVDSAPIPLSPVDSAPIPQSPMDSAPIPLSPVVPAPRASAGVAAAGSHDALVEQARAEGRVRWVPGISLENLLRQAVAVGASDLHVHSGAPLKVRITGRLATATEIAFDLAEAERLIFGLLDEPTRRAIEAGHQVDFAHEIAGVGRFRANTFRQQRGLDAVFRIIPSKPPSLAELGLPASLEKLTDYHQGIVLLTGPAGCGKSSTMAALVDIINRHRPDHIITVEDPIEFVHPSKQCVVNQRQVGPHTGSFARALRAALREDPDVIIIGELRDLETVQLALTAAETGHLVFGTLHTNSAIRTVNRLLGVFPPEKQAQIRTMVSESLRAIVSQRLVATADGSRRVPAIEMLISTKAVGNLIRDNKTFQIRSVLQTGAALGMYLLDNSLLELVKNGTISREEALLHCEEPKRFQ